jgi:ubiquinone/menaquinone biosynthesis C-methylase UbiE
MKINSFTPVAKAYTDKVSPFRHSQFLALAHELNLRGDERILDIGSGPGVLSLEIARYLGNEGRLHGVDICPVMVELANRNAAAIEARNVEFRTGDALDLPFENQSFDLVVSSNAFPWVPDRRRFLSEVHRVLAPGGRFGLVALSNKCYREFSEAFSHVAKSNRDLFPDGRPFEIMGARLHTLEELNRKVMQAGFTISKSFVFSTEEPIGAADYIDRVNAIVNENYLDHLNPNGERSRARALLYNQLAGRNGELRVTESSVFVISQKQ